MSKALKGSGVALLSIGIVLCVISFVLIFVAALSEREEVDVGDQNDFTSIAPRTYMLTVDSLDATSTIKIEVESFLSDRIEVAVRVENSDGIQIFDNIGTTPFEFEIDVSGDTSDHFDVTLEFRGGNYTISDVRVNVIGDTLSTSSLVLCCVSGIFPLVGVAMIIVGIILLVVGFTKKKGKKRPSYPVKRTSYERDPYAPPAGYGNVKTGSVTDDPNPYYQGDQIRPRALEGPPIDLENDW